MAYQGGDGDVNFAVRKFLGYGKLSGKSIDDLIVYFHVFMAALFIGHGPSFARGKSIAPFDNVAVAPLLRRLLGLPERSDLDGTAQPFAKVLKP